jgi:hypothetical protein
MLKKKFSVALLIVMGSFLVLASSIYASDAGAFLRIGAGARALAMGGAFTAIADDATAAYWNPAGLTQLEKQEVSSMYTNQFGLNIGYSFLNYARVFSEKNAFALSWIRLSADNIPKTGLDENGRPIIIDYFKEEDNAVLLSAARRLKEKISLGANIKTISGRIGEVNASGFGIDLGVLFSLSNSLKTGLVIKNIGANLKWNTGHSDTLPLTTTLGMAYKTTNNKVTVAVDIEKRTNRPLKFRGGAELWLSKDIAIRVGMNGENFTAGAGLRIGKLSLDYAYMSHDLGSSHRISLGLKL